jgi:hypothetical protein
MTAGGATALSVLGGSISQLMAREATPGTTPFRVKGLAMLSFADPEYLTIALPEAPHHQATLAVTPNGGESISQRLRGHGVLVGATPTISTKPNLRVPALVDVQELYPGARPKLDKSPTIISIPWSAVAGIAAETLSEDRWTFVVKETGEEVVTFRPRQVAESVRIDLVSSGVLNIDDGRLAVDLTRVSEVATEFVPMEHEMGGFSDHFGLYMPYVERRTGAPEIEPRVVGARSASVPTPSFGNSFAPRLWPYTACYPFRVG